MGDIDLPEFLVGGGRLDDILLTSSVSSDIDFFIAGATSFSWLISIYRHNICLELIILQCP